MTNRRRFFQTTLIGLTSLFGGNIYGRTPMINNFRRWRKQRMFTRAFKYTAKEKWFDQEITEDEFDKCMLAAKRPEVMQNALIQLEVEDGLLGGIKDWNWEAILKWFRDYFIPAMRIILPIMILLLDEED